MMEKKHDVAKWLSGEMSEQELREFRNSAGFDAYQKIATYAAELETSDFNSEPLLQAILLRPKTQTKVIRLKKWLFSAAAILVIALGCFFFIQAQTISEQAIAGNKTEFLLPDHSQVTLNSDSHIRYKNWNWNNNRILSLQGEAFFKVAKGKTFTVKTDLGSVTVLGTQFNVKARDNRFEAECFEGKVNVVFKDKAYLLSKGEIIVFDNGNLLDALPSNTLFPAWMQKQTRIISEGLPEILSEIERIYAVKTEIKTEIPNQKFTGFLPSDDLETALEIINKTYHLDCKTDTGNKIILISK